MGIINIHVEDDSGNRVSARIDLPSDVLPEPDDARFACLRFINPYGDTRFNRLQIPALLADLALLKDVRRGPEDQKLIEQIKLLANMCESEPHLYLVFIGD